MDPTIFQEVKDHINVTWSEEESDRKIERMIEDAKPILDYKLGADIDYSKPGMEHNLFLDYCMYVWNNCSNEFENNYLSEIMQIRQKYEVLNYEQEKK